MLSARAFATSAGILLASFATGANAQNVDTIVIKGSKFFYSGNGTQFFIKGVAYQQDFVPGRGETANGYTDPLADSDGCNRDIPYLQQLDTNTIRVYAIDPTKDHSACMTAFANAGIYVIADLAAPNESINSNDPAWDINLYARYTSVVDEMQQYSNLLGFFAGNEIVTQPNFTASAAFAKAAVRDMKAYIRSKNYRDIGVGYATSDNQYIRVPLAEYMDCGNSSDAIDFWGYNVYSWCGDSTFEQSGYQTRTEEFASYNVPVFFAEYGCNTVQPRTFTDVPVLFGPDMDGVWSGGIIYLYFQEVNNYGLVSVSGNSVSTLVDFNNLKSQIATVSPSGPNSASYSPTNSPASCPTANSDFSAATALPPTPDTALCECMYNSLSCVPSNDVNADSYGDLFNYVCGGNAALCAGIARNGTTGTYGQFGMCNPQQQLGFVLNEYYSSRGADATACSFSGSAVTQAAASATGSCSTQLAAASSANSAAGSAAASSSQGVGAVNTVAGFDVGYVTIGILVQVAVISGIGMIWL